MKTKTGIFLMYAFTLLVLIIPMTRINATAPRACELPGAPVPCASYQPDYNSSALKNILQTVYQWFLIIAAAACIGVIIWAGITYGTAGGDEDKVEKAKKHLIYGVIGVAIIIAAYGITQLIISTLGGNTIPTPDFGEIPLP